MKAQQLYVILMLLMTFHLSAQDQWKNVYTESAWTDRDKWQKADELIRQLNIKSGSKVADVGCHEGYMSFKLAKAVGENGIVYAVDTEQGKLDKLKSHSENRNVRNIMLIKGDYDDPKLPLNTFDAVIIVDTYHEMKDHDEILRHIFASLKTGGRLVLCEPIADERRNIERADQERKHELGIGYAIDDLKKAGFNIVKQQDPFVDRTKEKGDKMWLLVAAKK